MSSRIPDPHFISDSCSSLVVLAPGSKYTRHRGREELKFAHPSVQRYLTSERLRSAVGPASSFAFSETDAHSFIARSCLRYLLQFNKPDSLSSDIFTTFPLVTYSAESWSIHYRAIGDNSHRTIVDDLGIELMNIESNSFENWIRIKSPQKRFEGSDLERAEFASPLYYASLEGLLGLTKRLLEREADVNAQSRYYGSALQAAARSGDMTIVQLLLTNEADVNAQGGHYGSALQAAARSGDMTIVQLLLTNEADVNAQGGHYGSALQAAAIRGDITIAQLLLTHGADVNAQGGASGDALQAAISSRDVGLVRLLLEAGAAVRPEHDFGGYVGRKCYEVVELLLSYGYDFEKTDHQGRSILHRASLRGNIKMVEKLLSLNMDPRAWDNQGCNCLHLASASGDIQTIETFLDLGLDAGDLDKQRRNCLHHAAFSGWAHVTDRLLREQLDPNSADRDGWTPLHCAAKMEPCLGEGEGQELTVRHLLDAGADPMLKAMDGWTPYSVAIFHHRTHLLPLLSADDGLAKGGEIVVNPGSYHRGYRCDGCNTVSAVLLLHHLFRNF